MIVEDINFGFNGSSPTYLTPWQGKLYFSATGDFFVGTELWVSDGTAEGTEIVADIAPANGASSSPQLITPVGDWLLFSANDAQNSVPQEGETGRELWRSDGTEEGTSLVMDINPDGSSNPDNLTAFNGLVYFEADDGEHGIELWRSDGTPEGTSMLLDINPNGSSNPRGMGGGDAYLYFQADDGQGNGSELWRTDGTPEGTVAVQDIRPGPVGSFPIGFTLSNGRVYFAAEDAEHGYELWSLPVPGENAASSAWLIHE